MTGANWGVMVVGEIEAVDAWCSLQVSFLWRVKEIRGLSQRLT